MPMTEPELALFEMQIIVAEMTSTCPVIYRGQDYRQQFYCLLKY